MRTVLSLGLSEYVSRHPDDHPVEKLNEGDDAEAQEEAKEPSKGSNEVHWSHPDAPLKLWGKWGGLTSTQALRLTCLKK